MDFENILSTLQPFVIMFAALLGAFLAAMWIAVVIWTFRDIRSRSRDIFAQILATLMVLIFFPLFPLPGLVLYMILRPRETLSEIYERSLEEEALLQGIEERMACPGCNRRIEEDFMICPTCHTRLKKACPACGRLLHLRWNICAYCGAVQTAVKPVPAPPEPMSLAVEAAPSPLRLSQLSQAPGAQPEAQRETGAGQEPAPQTDTQWREESWREPEAQSWTTPQTAAEADDMYAGGFAEDPETEAASEPELQPEAADDAEALAGAEAEGEGGWAEPGTEPDQEDEEESLSPVSE